MSELPASVPDVAALQAELEAVKRREAEYRANMIHEFLDKGDRNTFVHTLHEQHAALLRRADEASAALESLVQKTAPLQAELEAIRRREAEYRVTMVKEFLDRGERNTFVQSLLQQRSLLIKREQAASADLETLVRKLEVETARVASLSDELEELKRTASWRLAAPFRWMARTLGLSRRRRPRPDPSDTGVPGGVFTYYLHTSPFRIYRDRSFTLRGWAWPEDGRSVTEIRVNVGGRLFVGRTGIAEPEVIARYGPQPSNPLPGFEITFDTPPGSHLLSLEAQLDGSEWRWIVKTTIWCEPEATP